MSTQRPRALITGLTGQDGSLLAEQLLADGYEVTGVIRRSPDDDLGCANDLRGKVGLLTADLLLADSLTDAVRDLAPDELYHLAAPTFVPDSWRDPAGTMNAIAGATATLLMAVSAHSPETRVVVTGSGEMFGDAPETPQREDTPCRPRTPYAAAKLAAHHLVGIIRQRTGIFACSAILYNHESERRPETFVTRKITRAAAAIKLELRNELTLGSTDAIRDWSYAPDVLDGCRRMLRQAEPRDYILASGAGRTVEDFLEVAFAHVGLDPVDYVRIDPELVRPPESTRSVGDASRARSELGWIPTVSFEQLVARMVDADLAELGDTPARSG